MKPQVQPVYVVRYRKPLGTEWKLDSLHKSRRLALLYVLESYGNDEGYDIKIEEYTL